MKDTEYVVLEYEDKSRYDGDMYNIYTRERGVLKYSMKLNREEYENFILDINVGNIKLYTSLISR